MLSFEEQLEKCENTAIDCWLVNTFQNTFLGLTYLIFKKKTDKYIGCVPFTDIHISDTGNFSHPKFVYTDTDAYKSWATIMKTLYHCTALLFLISCAFPFSPHHNVPSYYALFSFHGHAALLHRPATPFFHSFSDKAWAPNIVTESKRP
jgi:hypothetical protein